VIPVLPPTHDSTALVLASQEIHASMIVLTAARHRERFWKTRHCWTFSWESCSGDQIQRLSRCASLDDLTVKLFAIAGHPSVVCID